MPSACARLRTLPNPYSDLDEVPVAEMPRITNWEKIHLLHMHKHHMHGLGKRPGLPERLPTAEEVEKALEKALRLTESWMKREEKKK